MFDLDIIEMDWLNNSFKLSEEEIIKIYRSENITLSKYYEEIEKYKKILILRYRQKKDYYVLFLVIKKL